MVNVVAFERQLADESLRIVGPARRVDDLAVYEAVIATRSPTLRFPTLSSASGFVVAAAIVALFGGFLLTGVITQPRDEPLSPAAASVSSSPETDAPEESVHPNLLPGVELTLRDVGPGMYQVLSDGPHDLKQNVWDIAITPNGEAWVEKHRVVYGPKPYRDDRSEASDRGARVLRLGEPGTMTFTPDDDDLRLSLTPDGDVNVRGTGSYFGHVWRDGAWQEWEPRCPEALVGPGIEVDGMCWHHNGSGIRQYDRDVDGSERLVTHEDLGLAPGAGYGYRLALGSDGTVWTDTYARARDPEDPDPAPVFTGLASYDGERWTTVEADRPVPGDVAALAVAPDGTVWVVLADASGPSSTNIVMTWDGKTWDTYGPVDDGGSALWYSDIRFAPDGTVWVAFDDDRTLTVVKWDGATWDTFGPVEDPSEESGHGIHFAPDGRVWFGATTFYDGRDLQPLEIPATIGDGALRVGENAFGPDGSLWVVLIDMRDPKSLGCEVDPRACQGVAALYVITPEAVATVE
jgi:hypothetical protein